MNIRSAPLLPYVMCAVTHSNQTTRSYHRGHPLKISAGCQAFPMIWKDLIPYVPPGSSVAAIRPCMWIGQVTPVHINHVLCNWQSSWADLSGLTCCPMWVSYVCKPDLRTHAQGSTASYVQTSIQGTFWQTSPMSHIFTDDVMKRMDHRSLLWCWSRGIKHKTQWGRRRSYTCASWLGVWRPEQAMFMVMQKGNWSIHPL